MMNISASNIHCQNPTTSLFPIFLLAPWKTGDWLLTEKVVCLRTQNWHRNHPDASLPRLSRTNLAINGSAISLPWTGGMIYGSMKALPIWWNTWRLMHYTPNGACGKILPRMRERLHSGATAWMAFNPFKPMSIIQMKSALCSTQRLFMLKAVDC